MNKTISKVFIAADHRGVGLKLYLIEMPKSLLISRFNFS